MPSSNDNVGVLAQELARLDRAAKTAKDRLDEVKEKMMAVMDEHDLTKVEVPSGKATITLIDGERLDVDWETLNETDPKVGSKVRAEKVDLKLWRAAVTAGLISVDLVESVTTLVPYRQIKVSRK
jgi:hypothetical protein|tara:strand:- start:110 stop:484 length:375 start_codon:yes stop_codon:yes gene_type:complete